MDEKDRARSIRQKLAGMREGPERTGLPTGFRCLDWALGIGGWPRGEIVELYGPSSVGKTSLLLQSMAVAQQRGNSTAWIDADRCFDGAYATRLGVVLERLPLAQPQSAEEAFAMTLQLAESGALDLIAIDSAAALVPELELSLGVGSAGWGVATRVFGSGLRRIAAAAKRSDTCIIFLNQVRMRRDSMGRDVETSAGGPSLKLYAGVRIAMAATGRRVVFRVLKNRAAGAFQGGELLWKPGTGFTEAP